MTRSVHDGRAVRASRSFCMALGVLVVSSAFALAQPGGGGGGLPQVQFPAENPFSEAKRVLGKALFWDSQLSSDSTMSCGSCHIPADSGTDARTGINPGVDLLLGSNDDIIGSPGVSTMDQDDSYLNSVLYGLLPQVTSRQAQPALMNMFSNDLFWDGRASSQFVDPQTGEVVIAQGGALESQAVGPIVSSVEMAHQDRDWDQVIVKLEKARPLAMGSDLPSDLQTLVETASGYPDLFADAFGDESITAARIAMAIATYERTLLPDQTPFDAFIAGNQTALTPQQINGLNALTASRCVVCHAGAQFTDNSFRNVGLRPINEDRGRFEVTGNNADRGRFKVPSLRNIGLRDRFMHNGQLSTLGEVFDFYARRNGQVSFAQNRDPVLNAPIAFPPPVQNDIINFLVNGLTDQRVATESSPFDRPTLLREQPSSNPQIISSGIEGSGSLTPNMVALTPPYLGNDDFKIGIDNALGGAQAWVVLSSTPPVNGMIEQEDLLGPITLAGSGVGQGFGTMHDPIPDIVALDGQVRYMQWIVADPAAPNGLAASPVAELTLFCSMNSVCVDHCPADFTDDGQLDFFDVSAFLAAFNSASPEADLNGDGTHDFFDISAFLTAFSGGCP